MSVMDWHPDLLLASFLQRNLSRLVEIEPETTEGLTLLLHYNTDCNHLQHIHMVHLQDFNELYSNIAASLLKKISGIEGIEYGCYRHLLSAH